MPTSSDNRDTGNVYIIDFLVELGSVDLGLEPILIYS